MARSLRSLAVSFFFAFGWFHAATLHAQKQPVYAQHGMVVSTNRIASQIGTEILEKGGNAIDAAVATGFALAVVDIKAGNIGGGGFMVIRLHDGRVTTIDYREMAPRAAHEKMYLDESGHPVKNLNHEGYLSVGVPGTVAGLAMALEQFGALSLAQVIQPAIELAEKGFPVSYQLSRHFAASATRLEQYPSTTKAFYKEGGELYQPGELLVQQDLAETLKRIAANGRDGFYTGATADFIATQMQANGGLITKEDLASYHAVLRDPIVSSYRDYTVYGMPPPSSGGVTLAIMLNILEGFDLEKMGHNSARYMHVVVEAMRRAYADRATYLGDPDFNPDMPVSWLLSKEHGEALRRTINLEQASTSTPDSMSFDSSTRETTHFCVVDVEGNAVSNTYTLEYWFGSGIVVEGAGFLLNNEMGDFNAWPGHTDTLGRIGTKPNLIQPGKRMLSSMTPTLITKKDSLVMVIGSPGGRRIIGIVLQCILNVVDHQMNIFEAIDAPRFFHTWLPDVVDIEKWGTTTDTLERLQEMGHRLVIGRFNTSLGVLRTKGRAMGITIDPATGYRIGAADPRSADGAAVGY
ncbi:MAG: gamma-glutamyltransferase [bacterium]